MLGLPVPLKLPRTIILFHNPVQSQTNINYFNKSKSKMCLSPKQCGWESAKELRAKTKSITERAINWSDWSLASTDSLVYIWTVGYCTLLTFNSFCPMGPTNNSHAYVHMRGHCCHYNKQLSGCVNAARSPAWDEALFEKAATQT